MNRHLFIRHHVHLASPLQNISNYTQTIKDQMEIEERKLQFPPHTLTDALLAGSMKLAELVTLSQLRTSFCFCLRLRATMHLIINILNTISMLWALM